MYYTVEDAMEATVTRSQAIRELRQHSVVVEWFDSDTSDSGRCELYAVDDDGGELIAKSDEYGMFSGSDILGFLGY